MTDSEDDFGEDTFPDDEAEPTTGPEHSHQEPAAALVYASAVEFFVELLAQSYVREVNEGAAYAWCPEWYKHREALIRMESIWRAWEHLRLEPVLGISTWWWNHADPHMRKTPMPEKAALPHVAPAPPATPLSSASSWIGYGPHAPRHCGRSTRSWSSCTGPSEERFWNVRPSTAGRRPRRRIP